MPYTLATIHNPTLPTVTDNYYVCVSVHVHVYPYHVYMYMYMYVYIPDVYIHVILTPPSIQGGVTPIGAVSRAATGVKIFDRLKMALTA